MATHLTDVRDAAKQLERQIELDFVSVIRRGGRKSRETARRGILCACGCYHARVGIACPHCRRVATEAKLA